MVTYSSKSPDHQFEKKKLVEETENCLEKDVSDVAVQATVGNNLQHDWKQR
jgi:hypothetical protein